MTLNKLAKSGKIKKIGSFFKYFRDFAGGTEYSDGDQKWKVFTSTGPVNTSAFNPASLLYNPRSASIGSSTSPLSCDILVVAGGGGPGQGTYYGGGGGGGFVYYENLSVPVADHTVTVGSGGASRTLGGDSTVFPGTPAYIIAKGGGYGVQDTESRPGGPGGSGGGGSFRPNNFQPNNSGGSGTQPGQPGISGSSGRGSPGTGGTGPSDKGYNGGGAGGSNGASFGVPPNFYPVGGGTFPSSFLGAPSGSPAAYYSFSGGASGQTIGSANSIGGTNRGSGGGTAGVVIIKVR